MFSVGKGKPGQWILPRFITEIALQYLENTLISFLKGTWEDGGGSVSKMFIMQT